MIGFQDGVPFCLHVSFMRITRVCGFVSVFKAIIITYAWQQMCDALVRTSRYSAQNCAE